VLDVLDPRSVEDVAGRWSCVLLFNLLEHVYDPPLAMRHALRLLEPGGVVVVAAPVIWEAHDYPADYWRPMPGFYLEFARREGLEVVPGSPTWLLEDRLLPFDSLRDGSQHLVPSTRFAPLVQGHSDRGVGGALDRVVTRLGGGRWVFPFCGFGIALRLPGP
jgi:SAM-dependent methyltransferase